MGDMADLAREREFDAWLDAHFREEHFNKLFEENKWETRDKQVLKIVDMETSHILNCMKMITRSGDTWRSEWYPLLKSEYKRRERE